VLEVLYLIFNEGYAATSGERWIRQDLCDEALRLTRMLVKLAPREGEVLGLLALMELQSSRAAARVDALGQPVLLLEQDRSAWDAAAIERGLTALEAADRLAAELDDGHGLGPYALQAAIAACHARARRAEDTEWPRIAALYEALAVRQPSPVVELNRAVALSMAFGPAVGLEIVDRLMEEPALKQYHWLPSVRADLLSKLGRNAEAKEEFERAAAMTGNERERELLLKRAREQGH
jgi:predicted RNA polymerase sigma factor